MRLSTEEIKGRGRTIMCNRALGGGTALALFGSVARGDAGIDSDVDLLLAVDGAAPLCAAESVRHAMASGICPSCSVITRSFEQLERMAAVGNVFVLHLQLEGVVLSDPADRLRNILTSPNAIDFRSQKDGLRQASAVLYARDLDPRAAVTRRVAKHLLRRATMLECASHGRPVFAADAVSAGLADERLPAMLGSPSGAHPSPSALAMRSVLADYLGRPANIGETLAALARRPPTRSLARDLLSAAVIVAYDESVDEVLAAA